MRAVRSSSVLCMLFPGNCSSLRQECREVMAITITQKALNSTVEIAFC
ncbi:hypothetical protein A4U88_3760 [Serratia marcescens]|nr:hypothetical protein A4U88_3760 [Serratia marcescens]